MELTAVIVGVVAVATFSVVIALVLTRRRSTRSSSHELARAVDDMRARMDSLAQDLTEALDRAERESRRNRLFGELGGSIDIEEIVDRLLDAAMQIPGFDAAMVIVESQTGAATVRSRGMSPQEVAKPPTSGVPGALPGTITVSYRYGPDSELAQPDLIRGGVFVPLIGRELEPIGTLSLFWRQSGHEPEPEHLTAAEGLAESAIPAIENARRYGEARRMAETDALTGLFNQRFFHETLRREVLRAQRYERSLTLVVFDLDDFKAINDEVGHAAGDRVLAQAAERLREAVRSVDVPCRIGGDEFAVILPESTAADADQLYRRVHNSMRNTALGPDGGRLRISAGIAELQHGDTASSLFERADAALYRAKDLGKDRSDIARNADAP